MEVSTEFSTYVVIEFEDNRNDDIKKWLMTKLGDSKLDAGAELLTKLSENFEKKVIGNTQLNKFF